MLTDANYKHCRIKSRMKQGCKHDNVEPKNALVS